MIAVIIAKIEWVLQNNQNIATWFGTIGTWVGAGSIIFAYKGWKEQKKKEEREKWEQEVKVGVGKIDFSLNGPTKIEFGEWEICYGYDSYVIHLNLENTKNYTNKTMHYAINRLKINGCNFRQIVIRKFHSIDCYARQEFKYTLCTGVSISHLKNQTLIKDIRKENLDSNQQFFMLEIIKNHKKFLESVLEDKKQGECEIELRMYSENPESAFNGPRITVPFRITHNYKDDIKVKEAVNKAIEDIKWLEEKQKQTGSSHAERNK